MSEIKENLREVETEVGLLKMLYDGITSLLLSAFLTCGLYAFLTITKIINDETVKMAIFGISFIVFAIFLFVSSMKIQTKKEISVREGEQGSWIAAGYIFCVLGGLIGLVIGCKYVYSVQETVSGDRFYKYNESTRKHGKRMLILFAIMSILSVIMIII